MIIKNTCKHPKWYLLPNGEYLRGVCALCRLDKLPYPAPGTPAPKLP